MNIVPNQFMEYVCDNGSEDEGTPQSKLNVSAWTQEHKMEWLPPKIGWAFVILKQTWTSPLGRQTWQKTSWCAASAKFQYILLCLQTATGKFTSWNNSGVWVALPSCTQKMAIPHGPTGQKDKTQGTQSMFPAPSCRTYLPTMDCLQSTKGSVLAVVKMMRSENLVGTNKMLVLDLSSLLGIF